MQNSLTERQYLRILYDYAVKFRDDRLRSRKKLIDEKPAKYVIYLRKSTKSDEQQKDSIEEQENRCIEFATKNGLDIRDKDGNLRKIVEIESARTSDKRPQFSKMLKEINTNKYNSIIAWAPDRLARNMKEAGLLMDMVKKGILYDLKFPEFPFQRDAQSMLFLGISFISAENYSESLSKTTKRGIDDKVKVGRGMRADEVFGYKLTDNKRYRPEEPNFTFVKQAFQYVIEGKSLPEIAEIGNGLNLSRGKKTYMLDDKKLSQMLKKPIYAGIWVRGDNIVIMKDQDPNFEPCVSEKDFMKVRQMLKDKNTFTKGMRSRELPLREVVYCNNCGHRCYPTVSGGILYLNCGRRTGKCLNKARMNGQEILKFVGNVYKQLAELITEEDFNNIIADYKERKTNIVEDNTLQIEGIKSEIRRLQNNRAKKETTMSTLTNVSSLGVYAKEIEDILTDIADLEIKMKKIQSQNDRLLSPSPIEGMSYKKFSNFLKKADNKLKYSHDILLVDKMIKMVFSNLYISRQKIVSGRLNPLFLRYQKEVLSLNGVSNGS